MKTNEFLCIIERLVGFFKSLFWKSKNIVYVNGNVKTLNIEAIRPLIIPSDSHIANCRSKKRPSLCGYKSHFIKQKIYLYAITRNIKDFSKLSYCGFSSQMFSVFDGYVLGDTNNYNFFEIKKDNSSYYSISFNKIFSQQDIKIDDSKEEIDVIISTSYAIDFNKCLDFPKICFDKKAPDEISVEYLNEVFSFTKSVLDSCCNKKIKNVNLYITAKQSVAFVIGTAIQSYHPNVRVFNFDSNGFSYYIDVQKGKIGELIKHDK